MDASILIDLTSDTEEDERRPSKQKIEIDLTDDNLSIKPRYFLGSDQIPPACFHIRSRKSSSIQTHVSLPRSSPVQTSRPQEIGLNQNANLTPPISSTLLALQSYNEGVSDLAAPDGGPRRLLPKPGVFHALFDYEKDGKNQDEQDISDDQGSPSRWPGRAESGANAETEDRDYHRKEDGPPGRRIPVERSPKIDTNSEKSFDRSIGTDSPLATRIREKKAQRAQDHDLVRLPESPREVMARRSISRDKVLNIQQPNVVELEKKLIGFQQRVHADHAETVKWLLHDARRATAERRVSFVDDICPFASMRPVNAPAGQTPEGTTLLRIDTLMNKKKLARSITNLLTSKIASNVPRIPKYSSHTTVKRNILCADDEQLKFMPFLGDSKGDVKASVFNRLVKELDEVYSAKRSGSSQDNEMASKLSTYLDGWLEELDLGLDRQRLISYILEEDGESLGKSPKEIRLLRKAAGGPLATHMADIAASISGAFKTVFGTISITAVTLPDQRLREMLESANKPVLDSTSKRNSSHSESPKSQSSGAQHGTERLGTFTNLTCLICGAICCQTHGDYHRVEIHNSDESEMSDFEEVPMEEYEYIHQPVGMHYDEILRKQDGRLSKGSLQASLSVPNSAVAPCSDTCYLGFDYGGKTVELSRELMVALKSFITSMRPNVQPCIISFLLDVPCWEVHVKIQEIQIDEPNILETAFPSRSRGIDWYDSKRKALKSDWQELTSAHLHQERTQANPCAHDGPCTGNCPCATSNILCESFCGCFDDCRRRFTGCNCHASGLSCFSETCICIAMNRECGSQCVSCGAIDRIDPRNKYDDDLFTRGCQNIFLQRGVDRKLMIGESQLEGVGFGLYMGEPVQKGDYLSEYAGEVISFAEADRRGIIYDRKYMSFLFDLNSEWCIDAARLGNKTRFINHADSENNGLNCEAKIFLVNGEHRIKFVALRDIKPGEELLFNYGKKFAEKHGLTKRMPKAAKEGGKKGVIEGEEALEALDGNRARGKWTATRGGHGSGRGGRKATKSASMKPIRDIVAEVVEEAFHEDEGVLDGDQGEENEDDDDDDDDDENVREGRIKRKIRRPKRYTR